MAQSKLPFPDFQIKPSDALTEPDIWIRRVVFVEVKTGSSALTGRERQVRDVIEARAVEWAELRVAHR